MNWIQAIPIPVRLAALFALGTVAGSFLNLAIYRLAWHPRAISPWSRPAEQALPRRFWDRLPLVGWLGLRREATLHGAGHWVRPLLVELATGLLLAGLYHWEVVQQGLMLPPVAGLRAAGFMPAPDLATALHAEYLSQLLLISLMIVASLIDIDEKIIPDTITIPGTLAGLVAAVAYPWSLLPADSWKPAGGPLQVDFLKLTSPQPWHAMLQGAPRWESLAIASACWGMWCFALLPRRWNARRGWGKAWQLLLARLAREPVTKLILLLAVAGWFGIALAWWRAPLESWAGLLTALVGMAFAGGMIWVVRIVGSFMLGREAMGFGDVTLMAMIGSFLGWQTSLIVFFMAPFFGILVGVLLWVFRREREIPYGPFLCLAAFLTIVRWAALWEWADPIFGIAWLVPQVLVICMAAMTLLLGLMKLIFHRKPA